MSAPRAALHIKLCYDLPENIVCRHLCKNKNCIEHVEAGTAKENTHDRIRDGTAMIGEDSPCATIDSNTARQIFLSRLSGKTQKERAKEFHVTESIVKNIDKLKSWTHAITEEDKEKISKIRKKAARLTNDEILMIQKMKKECISIEKCVKLTQKTISQVKCVYSGQTKFRVTKPKVNDIFDKSDMTSQEISSFQQKLKDKYGLPEDKHWKCPTVNADGYGKIRFRGKLAFAHRVSYFVFHPECKILTKDDLIRHKCRFRNCLNPDHL